MLTKIVTAQDSKYKWFAKKSGETSINLSKELLNFLAPTLKQDEEMKIKFTVYKDDYIKALGCIINLMPLYVSSSQSSTEVNYDITYFQSQLSSINLFFGGRDQAEYEVNLKYRSDGRYYLNNLDNNGFNVRDYLVALYSIITFDKKGTQNILRLYVGPIKSNIKYLSSEEIGEAFFEYLDSKKGGITANNYKRAIQHLDNINEGKPIADNMALLGMAGTLFDCIDIAKISLLHKSITEDINNRIWNQTCSASVKAYLDFLISLYDNPQDLIDDYDDSVNLSDEPIQQIYFGAPGTGKSHSINLKAKGKTVFRTTFHPDSDYSTFVGAYKPIMREIPTTTIIGTKLVGVEDKNGDPIYERRIEYDYIPQAFVKSYVEAWRDLSKPVVLVIEEINRGNCAQIFGDIFQLLDRKKSGFSSYMIDPDEDLQKYLSSEFSNGIDDKAFPLIRSGQKMSLPPNLYIWATMNTSDQSLFPIDSAFKRRWDWKYVPIDTEKESWSISVNGNSYDWTDFLEKINAEIEETTTSEDKMLGFYFCKADKNVISAEKFVGKVIFYLWNDVFKDYGFDKSIFDDENGKLTFRKFYKKDGTIDKSKVERFLNNLKVEFHEEDTEGLNELEESGAKHKKLQSVTFPDGTKFSINDYTKADLFVKSLEKIGLEKIEPILNTDPLPFKRSNRPIVSKIQYEEILKSRYNYANVGDYYIIKDVMDDTKIGVLLLLKDKLNLEIKVEYNY